MFGTIGRLYQCYYDYLNLRYTDGTSLWQYVTVSSRQRDLFNVQTGGHPDAGVSGLRGLAEFLQSRHGHDGCDH